MPRYSFAMTFRAVVKDGLIVVNTHGALADGTAVEVVVPKGRREPLKRKAGAAKAKGPARGKPSKHAPGFGMWADRTDLGSPQEAVDRLRALTRRRRVG